MVAMQMRNKYVLDFTEVDFVPPDLDLGPFAAVDQKKPPKYVQYLGGWISV
jgi:hypothetical protein